MRDFYGAFGARRVGARFFPETFERIEVAPFQKIKSIVQRESAVGSA